MKDFCFCTVATANVLPELRLLIKSIRLFVGNFPILIVCDEAVSNDNHGENVSTLTHINQFNLKTVGGQKSYIIKRALEIYKRVLYVDCDVFFLGHWVPDLGKAEACMSPHLITEAQARHSGLYNSGYIGVNGPSDFPEWWDKQPKEVPGWYGDQKCLELWPDEKRGLFSEQHNVGFWRFWDSPFPVPGNIREASDKCFRLRTEGDAIFYNEGHLISVHSHFMHLPGYYPSNAPLCLTFNRKIISAMKQSSDQRHFELLAIMGRNLNV